MIKTIFTLRRRNLKNAALFLRLGLPSTLILIHHENGAFRKRSLNRRNLKTLAKIGLVNYSAINIPSKRTEQAS